MIRTRPEQTSFVQDTTQYPNPSFLIRAIGAPLLPTTPALTLAPWF